MSTSMPDGVPASPVAPSPGARGARVSARGFGLTPAGAERPVLSGVDLEIEPGEVLLLTGPSGAGKSTFLHALAGVLEAEEQDGDAEVHGVRMSGDLLVDGAAPAGGRAGLVQQDPETQVVMARVGDDVAFGAENLGVAPEAIWPRVSSALAAVGLGTIPLNHPTHALSGGQKQRLAVAGLLAMGPKLWLLDEPTANLDPEGADQLREVVVATARDYGATVIVVEHRLDLWLSHVNRLVVLASPEPDQSATVLADGEPRHLLAKPGVVQSLLAAGVRVPGHEPNPGPAPKTTAGETLLQARALGATRASVPRRQAARAKLTPAVADVDLDVREGEAVVLVGHNGQGKTALALTLAGLQRTAAGSLTLSHSLRGDAKRDSPERLRPKELVRRIGMVFQDPEHQFLTRKVRDELAFGPKRAGLEPEQVDERVDGLLSRLHLNHVAHLNPYQLSGGQQRRLSVGTALATRPRLLVLDEPTFGQDANTWLDLVLLLREELSRGTAIVAVTHDRDFSRALSARRILVEGGRACEQK